MEQTMSLEQTVAPEPARDGYAVRISRMDRLVQEQRDLKSVLSRSMLFHYVMSTRITSRGERIHGHYERASLPESVQSLIQSRLSANAWTLTHANIALAFCRNRLRRGAPELGSTRAAYVLVWITQLSEGSGWTNLDAVKAQYAAWRKWCESSALGVALPRPDTLPWQRECIRRSRAVKRKKRLAGKCQTVRPDQTQLQTDHEK